MPPTMEEFKFSVATPTERTLGALLTSASRRGPARTWLRFGTGLNLTAQEVDEEANRLANGMAARGVRKGDRVAAMCANGWPLVCTWFAAAKLGAIFVPLNTHYRGQILAHALQVSDPRLVVADQRYVDTIGACRATPDADLVAVSPLAAESGAAAVTAAAFGSLRAKSAVAPDVEVAPSDPQAIIFTSGTTGPSKGVLVSHQQAYAYADIVGQACELSERDVYLTCLPLFHVNAQLTVTTGLIFGNEVVVHPAFSASAFWSWIASARATVVSFFGSMAHILLKEKKWPESGVSLRACWLFPSSMAIAERLSASLGVSTYTAYASTESNFVTIGGSSFGTPMDSVGSVHPLFQAKVVDPATGSELPPGRRGEIRTRPRQDNVTMLEYFGMPEATAAAYDDEWFRTGDVGFFDTDGYLHFVDRLSDSIRQNGENISSMEVEAVLSQHEDILECAVVGIPGAMAEQEVMAVFVPRSDSEPPSAAELTAWAKARMAYFMVPNVWLVVPSLPKTPTGKVLKAQLRKMRP